MDHYWSTLSGSGEDCLPIRRHGLKTRGYSRCAPVGRDLVSGQFSLCMIASPKWGDLLDCSTLPPSE